MIAHLKGKTIDKAEKYLVIQTNDVGYKVFATAETMEHALLETDLELWIYHVIREDASDLYGFSTRDDLKFFELLISISGIGPRTALGILNVATVAALKKAVSSSDTAHLVKVSGISKKVADKIVLELKGKVGEEAEGAGLKEEMDALEALKALGFSHGATREALKQVDNEPDTNTKIKKALKILGR